jgi:hypothetical protein
VTVVAIVVCCHSSPADRTLSAPMRNSRETEAICV